MTMTAAEKQNIETQALLKRADMAIKNTGKVPAKLTKQLFENEGGTERFEEILKKTAKTIGPEEIERMDNMSIEELEAEYEKDMDEILNDPFFDDIITPEMRTMLAK